MIRFAERLFREIGAWSPTSGSQIQPLVPGSDGELWNGGQAPKPRSLAEGLESHDIYTVSMISTPTTQINSLADRGSLHLPDAHLYNIHFGREDV